MPKTLVAISQITPPPNINSNAALLTDIARFEALNPRERLALQVWLRAKTLANDTDNPLTNYDPATASNVMALIQDANTVFGNIPTGDLCRADLVIDWYICKALVAGTSSDVDDLRNGTNMGLLSEMSEDALMRANLYLKLEIGV